MSSNLIHHSGSYRDPSGFIFEKDGILYRQVNKSFQKHFDHFINEGCYHHFVEKRWLVPHATQPVNLTGDDAWYTTLQPERIPFISYPYEWSFDMLKDAALHTLRLAKEALRFGMTLKDASPYNIQWRNGQPVFIDSLSFERFTETPWKAYRQFCENFLGPLLVAHYSQQPMQALQMAWPEGIPLQVIKSFLPKKTRFSLHIYLHIHLHAGIASKNVPQKNEPPHFAKSKFINLLSSLELLIGRLKLRDGKSTWSKYYDEVAGRKDYLDLKKNLVGRWLDELPSISTAADLGANEGEFSQILASRNIATIAVDFDPYCVNRLYNKIKTSAQANIQPLTIDLANPSPAIGFNNEERGSFISRLNVDLVLALALVHHLCIGKNVPLDLIASFFGRVARQLIIEFVPPNDDKTILMMAQKAMRFDQYNQQEFEASFEKYFVILKKEEIGNSGRVLYLMVKKVNGPGL
jgi:hypothetical protein